MKIIEINSENVHVAAKLLADNQPILMLNLLKFKAQASYEKEEKATPCTGREAYYQRYVPAFNKIASGIGGIEPFFIGQAITNIVGPTEEGWDEVALISYPNFDAFRKITESAEYATEADKHRVAALDDWRLIATVKVTL